MPALLFEQIIADSNADVVKLLRDLDALSPEELAQSFENLKAADQRRVEEVVENLFRSDAFFSVAVLHIYKSIMVIFLEKFRADIVSTLNRLWGVPDRRRPISLIFTNFLLNADTSQASFGIVQCCEPKVFADVFAALAGDLRFDELVAADGNPDNIVWAWGRGWQVYADMVTHMSLCREARGAVDPVFMRIEKSTAELSLVRAIVVCSQKLQALKLGYRVGSIFGVCKKRLLYVRSLKEVLAHILYNDDLQTRHVFVKELASLLGSLPENFIQQNAVLSYRLKEIHEGLAGLSWPDGPSLEEKGFDRDIRLAVKKGDSTWFGMAVKYNSGVGEPVFLLKVGQVAVRLKVQIPSEESKSAEAEPDGNLVGLHDLLLRVVENGQAGVQGSLPELAAAIRAYTKEDVDATEEAIEAALDSVMAAGYGVLPSELDHQLVEGGRSRVSSGVSVGTDISDMDSPSVFRQRAMTEVVAWREAGCKLPGGEVDPLSDEKKQGPASSTL